MRRELLPILAQVTFLTSVFEVTEKAANPLTRETGIMADPWEEFAKNYPVHEESYLLTDAMKAKSIKHLSEYGLEEANEVYTALLKTAAGDVSFDGEVQEVLVPSPDVATGIPVSIYKPTKCAPSPVILIFFHAGGLVMFDRQYAEAAVQTIAMEAGCIGVNVEYRLLPDQSNGHAPFDDGKAVVTWVLENKEKIGGGPDSKVGVGGDSSGGQISASVANEVPGDSGMMYAEKLRAAEVRVRIVVIEGVPHNFFACPGVFKTKCQEAYGHVVNFLKDFQ